MTSSGAGPASPRLLTVPQGDDLDAKIRKTEKELRALRKTLDHLTDRNTRYRKNVTKVRRRRAASTTHAVTRTCAGGHQLAGR